MKKTKKLQQKVENKKITNEKLRKASILEEKELFAVYQTSRDGLKANQIILNRNKYGNNKIEHSDKLPLYKRLFKAFINPFTAILLLLVIVSLINDIILAEEKEYITVVIILTMVILSGVLKFFQETKSENAAEKLLEIVETTITVQRDEIKSDIPLDELVAGDIYYLSAGDIVPADSRIIFAKDLFISQSSLTGESIPIEKSSNTLTNSDENITDIANLVFMGSNVISGTAIAVVIITGTETMFGQVAKDISVKKNKTGFELGINSVSWLLIKFMMVMVPVVFFINGISKGNWLDAFLFAISIAVGLTPEMLPMIVTTCLAKGAVAMSKKKTIIKKLDSIQNFGSIDILCTDKTGTLTEDKITLTQYLNIDNKLDLRVLRHAYLNSYFQTGLKNLMDLSVIEKMNEYKNEYDMNNYIKVDEIPFDFSRRRMSVVIKSNDTSKTQMITKGAVEEILTICKYVEYENRVIELTNDMKRKITAKIDHYNGEGHRVIAIAQKSNPSVVGEFGIKDESEMVLIGYLTFLDLPKESARNAIESLHEYGITVKVLTGDNEKVTVSVCKQLRIDASIVLLGTDVELLTEDELCQKVEKISVFAKLSPDQKVKVVRALRKNGHIVGYLGDGINDASAMKASDVGISVDTAVDIAKESADVILLEKDLNILKEGVIEGRKTYANMIKYIKMTASSNFGNMFSVLVASAFLPFLPMAPIHLILLNLIYDVSCIMIPWDNVDEEFLKIPRKWDAKSVGKFMLWIGPTSSVFDITTYLLMFFIICPKAFGGSYSSLDQKTQIQFMMMFQAGWFIESMWTQSLVIHMIRTPKIPFVESRASLVVLIFNLLGIAVLTVIPFTGLGNILGFVSPPPVYFIYLIATVISYMLLVTVIKKVFIKKYGELL